MNLSEGPNYFGAGITLEPSRLTETLESFGMDPIAAGVLQNRPDLAEQYIVAQRHLTMIIDLNETQKAAVTDAFPVPVPVSELIAVVHEIRTLRNPDAEYTENFPVLSRIMEVADTLEDRIIKEKDLLIFFALNALECTPDDFSYIKELIEIQSMQNSIIIEFSKVKEKIHASEGIVDEDLEILRNLRDDSNELSTLRSSLLQKYRTEQY